MPSACTGYIVDVLIVLYNALCITSKLGKVGMLLSLLGICFCLGMRVNLRT